MTSAQWLASRCLTESAYRGLQELQGFEVVLPRTFVGRGCRCHELAGIHNQDLTRSYSAPVSWIWLLAT